MGRTTRCTQMFAAKNEKLIQVIKNKIKNERLISGKTGISHDTEM